MDFNEIFIKFRIPIFILLGGLAIVAIGIISIKVGQNSGTKVEVLSESAINPSENKITVEIAGSVVSPGVYNVANSARINDLLVMAGGISADADRVWIDKYLNKAAKVIDGQKIYIPAIGEQTLGASANNGVGNQTTSSSNSLTGGTPVNVNTASIKDLDSLPGIGPTYAQNIIDHRPYSTLEELVSKGAIKQSLLDKIKERVSIY